MKALPMLNQQIYPTTPTIDTHSLGIFVGGFRWSGSGAVSDWLGGHENINLIKNSAASFGEIRALNYGVRYLTQTAMKIIPWGETLGRWAICPSPDLWKKTLGPTLTSRRNSLAPIYSLADFLFTSIARFHIIPGVHAYKTLLDAQIGGDFRKNSAYLQAVSDFSMALHAYMRENDKTEFPQKPWENPHVARCASKIISLFFNSLSENGTIPLFDNTFSGINPDLFKLIVPELFSKKIFILVRRDPRDQFADLVKYSGATYFWNINSFIHGYRRSQKTISEFLRTYGNETQTLIRLINFEDFILDTAHTRSKFQQELLTFWNSDEAMRNKKWTSGSFQPEESAKNIGLWHRAGLPNSIKKITKELPEFLVKEAD